MTHLQHTLESLGLNDKEIQIYTTLLSTGVSPASTLGQRTGITRSTAQYVCQQLAKKGLVGMAQKGNTYLFTAEPPEKLLFLLKREQDELKQKEEEVNRIIGALRSLQSSNTAMPKVRFYEGLEGMMAAYTEILADLKMGGEIVGYLQPLDLEQFENIASPLTAKFLADITSKFDTECVRKRIRTRLLCPPSIQIERRMQEAEGLLEEIRLMPVSRYEGQPTEILLFNDKMYSMTFKGDMAFAYIMQNEPMTRMHRAAFEAAWDGTEPRMKGKKRS